MKFVLALGAALAATWPGGSAAALNLSGKDFKGSGRCQFAVHGFALSPQTEKAIGNSVQKLLERHQAVFGFQTRSDFRLRIRVFGRFADYTNATLTCYWTNVAEQRAMAGQLSHVAGFYASGTREIVTWRQQLPGALGTTLLHEAGHAIMDAHYEDVPLWMLEGSAEYFAFALHPPDEMHQRVLRHRWTRLNLWLKQGELLPLDTLLNADSQAFRQLEPEKAYATSWSLFQWLMSSDANRRTMLSLLRERQESSRDRRGSAEQMARLYPGGLQHLEKAWHSWIVAGAGMTNSPRSSPPPRGDR